MAGEKRSQDQDETARTVLVDIEGTTTSIGFVKAKKDEKDKLDGFVAITDEKPEEEKDSLLKNVLWQMDNDRKTGALKQLQGHMWREAYKTGTVKAHVYEDVPKAFESWKNDGRKIYVYSSGSVEAQKLLFGHSIHGDLLKYFSGFFDTEVGAKQESDSYKNILSKIDDKPSNVVFLTDAVKEAAAAKEAGLSTIIVVREGNAALNDEEKIMYTTIKSFLDLTFQTSTKRQKLETANEKVEKDTTDVSEPMDTSEDVEIPDINDQKNEKNKDVKGVTESEGTECLKNQLSQDAAISLPPKEEAMVIEKEPLNSEQKTPVVEAEESGVKHKGMNKDTSSSGNVEETMKDDAIATKNSDQIAIPEKTEEDLDTITTEIIPTANKSLDVSISESISKSENTPTSSEKKIKDSTDIAKNVQAELVNKTQTVENDKKDDIEQPQSQNCDKTKKEADKPEECLTAEKDEIKEESKIVSGISESEKNVLTKNEKKEIKNQESTVVDFTENGEIVQAAVEKTIVAETEATTSTTDVKKEITTEASAEKCLETVAKPEKIDEKTPQETEETVVTDAEKRENETTKQEVIKDEDTVKEENVVDMKDKNIVDSEKQKLNGTAQNGNTDVPVLDDKLHSNGLNEGTSKETTSEEAAAQNGEPESSSESSAAESIKVKKVVDSTVVDGAGEPDVVPPVVVAATS
ncbi:enolase-phosphatase E1 isoform X2 [Polyergus mexicanus]|uniref:enolase-phosphatase E1 isoform X2 n=1 Tax=Polyergus mexicanus TaxID=615972 RepID=UPI0038B49977